MFPLLVQRYLDFIIFLIIYCSILYDDSISFIIEYLHNSFIAVIFNLTMKLKSSLIVF